MKTEHPALGLLTDLIEDIKTESASQNVKEWSQMPPISDELYQELVKEFNNERLYFFNDSYNLED